MRQQFPIIRETVQDERRFQASCYLERRDIITFDVENEKLGTLLTITIDQYPAGDASVFLTRSQVVLLKDWLVAALDN